MSLDQILKNYSFEKTVAVTRTIVLSCSFLELLLVIFHWLPNSSLFAQFIYTVSLLASTVVSAFNLSYYADDRQNIKKIFNEPPPNRNSVLFLLLTPMIAGFIVFFGVTGHFFISTFALIHLVLATAQLVLEVFEASKMELAAPESAPKSGMEKEN